MHIDVSPYSFVKAPGALVSAFLINGCCLMGFVICVFIHSIMAVDTGTSMFNIKLGYLVKSVLKKLKQII